MATTLMNPIIPGFAPDPSVILVKDTFFLINSTFHMFPGLPIYASKDLVNWVQIGNAINRQTQLSLRLSDTKLHRQPDGHVMLATGGLFAPTIRYHAASGKIYVINTNVIHPEDGGTDITENFVVSTDDIWSDKWSDPVWFDFEGIDPSIFWDDDGKAYVCGSGGPGPMTKIHLFEIDLVTGKKRSEEKTIWDGTGGIYPEGPHFYKRDDYYYLLISEGGTWKDHMITVARAKHIWGPYEAHPSNPVLTARGTDEYVQATGHCDMFQDPKGNWWGACLGIRITGERFIMGRESFLTPGKWEVGQWPSLQNVKIDGASGAVSSPQSAAKSTIKPRKGADWLYIRDAVLKHHRLDPDLSGSSITLTPSNADVSQWKQPVTFIGKRQRSLNGHASVTLELPKLGSRVQTGLIHYKDEHRYARIFYDAEPGQLVFEVVNNASKISRTERTDLGVGTVKEVQLSIDYSEEELKFACSTNGSRNATLLVTVDTAELSNPDFIGPVIGVYAVSPDESPDVAFRDFSEA